MTSETIEWVEVDLLYGCGHLLGKGTFSSNSLDKGPDGNYLAVESVEKCPICTE